MRHLLLVVVCLSALLFPNLAATATRHTGAQANGSPGALGVVPPQVNGQPVSSIGSARPAAAATGLSDPTHSDNLTYQGGPVMRTVTNYVIYWVPATYTTASNYSTVIDGYFTNVAADSGGTTNVYSAGVQYSDGSGSIAYSSAFGGSATDTQSFPSDGCTNPSDVNDATNCLSDAQLQAEVKRFADLQGWPHGPNVEFFLYTPANVGSCYDASDCAYDTYCAYHSEFDSGSPSSEYIYANMPWPNQSVTFGDTTYGSDCDSGQHPNGSGGSLDSLNAADEVLNVTSHENNESITDPLGTAWWVNNSGSAFDGEEDGDLCAWYFPNSSVLGGSIASADAYNQQIGTGHYFLQGEWSNASATSTGNSGCVWNYATGAPPANTAAPTITGTATVGHVLTGNAGSWSNNPTKYTYVWQRCDSGGASCATIKTVAKSTATSPTYTLVTADDKHTIRLSVMAINAIGSSAAQVTLATAVVNGEPVYSSGFSLTGTATVGQTLTAQAGTWSMTPTKYTYTWQRCDSGGANCATIKTLAGTSATSATYTLVAADDKHTIKVSVFALNAAGTGTPQTSSATSVVNGEPVYSSGFSLTGTATVGQTLTAQAGTWSMTPTKYTYTWQRCDSGGANCATIKTLAGTSATSATYTLVAADDKHTIKVSVFALNAAGTGTPQTSSATSVVNGEPVYSSGFSLTGTATVGQTLTAQAGTWSMTPTKYTYTWQRCDSGGANCATIKTLAGTSATSATYTLVAADDKHTIKVSVFALNAAGTGTPQTSSATSVVNGEPVYSSGFSLTGTATVGQTLTAQAGTWSPTATKYSYLWQRCDSGGDHCTTIMTVTSSSATTTYKLLAADQTHTIKVTVTATNSAGASVAETSPATSVVA